MSQTSRTIDNLPSLPSLPSSPSQSDVGTKLRRVDAPSRTLTLTHTQRINLDAILGLSPTTVSGMREVAPILDRIGLQPDEKESIGYRAGVNGQITWDPDATLPSVEFGFSISEISRIRMCLESWSNYLPTRDNAWLVPLLAQLDNERR